MVTLFYIESMIIFLNTDYLICIYIICLLMTLAILTDSLKILEVV